MTFKPYVEGLRSAVDEYVEELQTTLAGRYYDLSQPDSKNAYKEELLETFSKVLQVRDRQEMALQEVSRDVQQPAPRERRHLHALQQPRWFPWWRSVDGAR